MGPVAAVSTGRITMASIFWARKFSTWPTCLALSFLASTMVRSMSLWAAPHFVIESRTKVSQTSSNSAMVTPILTFLSAADAVEANPSAAIVISAIATLFMDSVPPQEVSSRCNGSDASTSRSEHQSVLKLGCRLPPPLARTTPADLRDPDRAMLGQGTLRGQADSEWGREPSRARRGFATAPPRAHRAARPTGHRTDGARIPRVVPEIWCVFSPTTASRSATSPRVRACELCGGRPLLAPVPVRLHRHVPLPLSPAHHGAGAPDRGFQAGSSPRRRPRL